MSVSPQPPSGGSTPIHPKVAASALAGAVTVLGVSIVHACGVTIDPPISAAVTTVLTVAAGYFAPGEVD